MPPPPMAAGAPRRSAFASSERLTSVPPGNRGVAEALPHDLRTKRRIFVAVRQVHPYNARLPDS